MMRPTKERAIERLQRALDELANLKSKNSSSQEFMVWRRNTSMAIAYVFDRQNRVTEFTNITWSSSVPQNRRSAYGRGIERASALLKSMIHEVEEYWTDVSNVRAGNRQQLETESVPVKTEQVFVVHGRNQRARNALFAFLRTIGLRPLEWNEAVQATGKPTPYIGEILDAAFTQAGAVVVLMTPDDEARLREPFRSPNDPPHETELTGQARPNVLFEAGMAMGRNTDRTILVELGSLRPFSDVSGLHVIRMDNSSQRRQELAQRLESAGCPVNLDGIDWHTAGDFDAALSGI